MGVERQQSNGRKFVDGAYVKAMQGSMYCVDALLKQGVVGREEGDLVVVQNSHWAEGEAGRWGVPGDQEEGARADEEEGDTARVEVQVQRRQCRHQQRSDDCVRVRVAKLNLTSNA